MHSTSVSSESFVWVTAGKGCYKSLLSYEREENQSGTSLFFEECPLKRESVDIPDSPVHVPV